MWTLVRKVKAIVREGEGRAREDGVGANGAVVGDALKYEGGGFLAPVFGKLFNIVDTPWKMFPLGFLFGLGFDTSSEIAILGIASIHAVKGTSIWLILIFPMLFTGNPAPLIPHCRCSLLRWHRMITDPLSLSLAAMALIDTADGALMSTVYTSPAFARDPLATLYYSIVLTAITVTVSAFVAAVQILSLIAYFVVDDDEHSPFWDGVEALADRFDIIGAAICGVFVVAGLGAVVVYRPWRRRMEGSRGGV